MARVALIKVFTGLNLGVSQLSGELQRAGHDSRVIYFKDFLVVPVEDAASYEVTDYPGVLVGARGKETVWNCFTPFSDREYDLLFQVLDEFHPDLIGFSLTSLVMKQAAAMTARLKQRYPQLPIIWGGSGPTLELEWCLQHADMVCTGEGEELIVELADRIDEGADYADLHDLALKRDGEDHPQPEPAAARSREDRHPGLRSVAHVPHRRRHAPPRRLSGVLRRPAVPDHDPARVPVLVLLLHRERVPGHVRQEELAPPPLGRRRHRGAGAGEAEPGHPPGDVLRRRLHREPALAARVRAALQARGRPALLVLHVSHDHQKDELLLLKDAGLRSITMGIQSGSEAMLQNFNRPVAQDKAIEAARLIAECGIDSYFDLITRVQFEKEEHCRETFNFLVQLPVEMKSAGFGAMTMFPNYGYTEKVAKEGAAVTLGDEDYLYYHKLYLPDAHHAASQRRQGHRQLQADASLPAADRPLPARRAAEVLPRRGRVRASSPARCSTCRTRRPSSPAVGSIAGWATATRPRTPERDQRGACCARAARGPFGRNADRSSRLRSRIVSGVTSTSSSSSIHSRLVLEAHGVVRR